MVRLVEKGGQGVRVRRLGGDRAGEIQLTRFLRNEKVTIDEMLTEACQRTAERSAGRDVMVIQDTTVVRWQGGGGDYLHVAVALDATDGAILGLVDGQFLRRTAERKAQRREMPVEEKESFRWLQAVDQAASICAGADRIIAVSDRESDIYEALPGAPTASICGSGRRRIAAWRMADSCSQPSMPWARRAGPRSNCRLSPAGASGPRNWPCASPP